VAAVKRDGDVRVVVMLHAEDPAIIGKEVRALRASFPTVQYAFPA